MTILAVGRHSAGFGRDRRWLNLGAAALIIAGGLAAYSNSFHVPFVFDDLPTIRDNPAVRSFASAWKASPGAGITSSGRPLVGLSFALNSVWSGTGVAGFHAFNLAVHLCAALVLFGLVRRTLARIGGQAGDSTSIAWIVALVWELHPLQTESVTYIVQRTEAMMGLFYLLTVYCFLRYAEFSQPEAKGMPAVWSGLSVLSCLLGMACKEVMVSAPIVVMLYDRTFVSGNLLTAWRRHKWLFIGLASTWLLLIAEVNLTAGRGRTAGFAAHVAWWQYARAQSPAIMHYLRLCFWPHPLIFDYGAGLDWHQGLVGFSTLGVVGLLIVTGVLLVRRPALGFCGVAFFALLAPSSSVVPIATQIAAEHRMYLPLAAIIVLAVLGLERLRAAAFGRNPPSAAGGLALAVLLAAVLGTASFDRNRTYASGLTLWTETARNAPDNPRAAENVGCSLMEAGRLREAANQFVVVIKRDPRYADAHRNLANCLVALGRSEEAIPHYELSVPGPDSAGILKNLGDSWSQLPGRAQYAIAAYQAALRLKPNFPAVHDNLGNLLANQPGRLAEAIAEYQAALRLDPNDAEGHFNLGNAWAAVPGKMADAADEFQEAVRLRPDFPEAHFNLAAALLSLPGRKAQAGRELQAFLRLRPDNQDARELLAQLGILPP